MRRSIHVLAACVIALVLSTGTAWASGGGGNDHSSTGSGNCSNAGASTTGQCSSNNALVQQNVAVINYGEQSNNANQNNQPGGGNSNNQQSEADGGNGNGGSGSFNCSNVGSSTVGQCSANNELIQSNVTGVNHGDQKNNANQNNQPGGGNSNYQQSEGGNGNDGGHGGGSFNCSNLGASTVDQCKSNNVLEQRNSSGTDDLVKTDQNGPRGPFERSGDQSNNANQNNQPGGGNSNYQQSKGGSYENGKGHGGGSFNCSNAFSSTSGQCYSSNSLEQSNSTGESSCPATAICTTSGRSLGHPGESGDQKNNANQNNQPGGGNSNYQQSKGGGDGGRGGGSFNCSNFASSTDGQCYSSNELTQDNSHGGQPPCVASSICGFSPKSDGFGGSGDQKNNANQNNQPGGGNSNYQQSHSYDKEKQHGDYEKKRCDCEKRDSYDKEKQHGQDGGSFNCSNAFSITEGQCYSSNSLEQSNSSDGPVKMLIGGPGGFGGSGDQKNNANQNNQPGGGNTNYQQSRSGSRW